MLCLGGVDGGQGGLELALEQRHARRIEEHVAHLVELARVKVAHVEGASVVIAIVVGVAVACRCRR